MLGRAVSHGRTAAPRRLSSLRFVAVPAVLWAAYALLVLPYVAIRSVGDDWLPWLDIRPLERALFLGELPPQFLQRHLYSPDRAWFDYAGYWVHLTWFFIPLGFGLVVTLFERDRLLEYLGWILAACYLADLCYLVLPIHPPWMYDGIDRILLSRSFVEYTGVDNNPVATLPSLHAGEPMVIALFFLFRAKRTRLVGLAALAFAVVVGFFVVYLGEHWVVDVLAGYALAAGVAYLFVSERMHRLYARIPGQPVARLARLNAAISRYGPSPPDAGREEEPAPVERPRAA